MNMPTKAKDASTSSDRWPSYVDSNLLDPAEKVRRHELMAKKGVRLLPYPFASAMAVVSDLDGSSRGRYESYVGELVGRLGLDFGDSTWLRWKPSRYKGAPSGLGFGFFNPSLSMGKADDPQIFDTTRTFCENIGHYHLGNVDHFHAFLPEGPRVILVENFERQGGLVRVRVGETSKQGVWNCAGLRLFGICVVGKPDQPLQTASLEVKTKDGPAIDSYRLAPFNAPSDNRQYRFFAAQQAPGDDAVIPEIDDIAEINVAFETPQGADHVERLILASIYPEMLLGRLRLLRDRYNIEAGLVTEHAGLHFRSRLWTEKFDQRLADDLKVASGKALGLCGNLFDDAGRPVLSTDSDVPHSFGRVLPELVTELQARFVVPLAANSPTGWDGLDVVTPTGTRSDVGIYFARRMVPNIQDPLPGKRMDRTKSRAETFVARLEKIMEGASRSPGLFWPLYTHLGGFDKERARAYEVFEPYFDPAHLEALQDRVFNITGALEPGGRLWFARASVLYDYALIRRDIGDHLTRIGENVVDIASWQDETLDRRLPLSPAQLYGLTLYVDDPWNAAVRLDGTPLPHLTRNPPDETGRTSVTIAESEIHHTVFDNIDPFVDQTGTSISGAASWRWSESQGETPQFGTLGIEPTAAGKASPSADQLVRVSFPMHEWVPFGAQLFTFSIRCGAGAAFGVQLETSDGGRFLFAHDEVVRRMDEPRTATYRLDQPASARADWMVIVVPFHDLEWSAEAAPGGPFPSHPVRWISLIASGECWSSIDVARMAFLRPRATSLTAGGRAGFCVAGCVSDFVAGQEVHIAPEGHSAAPPQSELVDQRGWFCFAEMPPGIYRIWSDGPSGRLIDRRGPVVDVVADVASLTIDRSETSEAAPSQSD